MTDQTHTIKMKKEHLDSWLEGLRGGKFEQAREYLCDGHGYCCLGVLQMAVSGVIVKDTVQDTELPDREWLKKEGIEFYDENDLLSSEPWLPSLASLASQANDDGESFKVIADAIQKATITY